MKHREQSDRHHPADDQPCLNGVRETHTGSIDPIRDQLELKSPARNWYTMNVKLFRSLLFILLNLLVVPAQAQDAAPITITIEQFGIGNRYRPGDLVPARFVVTSRLQEAVGAFLVWEVEESTGDLVEYTRPITLNPGLPNPVWMYAKSLPNLEVSANFRVRVYERTEDNVRGRELAANILSPARLQGGSAASVVPITESMIAIVGGSSTLGLDQYSIAMPQSPPVATNDPVQVVFGLTAQGLPDRWYGLDSLSTIVWAGRETPQNLTTDQARAIREWIFRGGHLVIVMQMAGDPWGIGEGTIRTPLQDLLPETAPQVESGISVPTLAPVITKDGRIRTSPSDQPIDIRVFRTFDNYYAPVVSLQNGDALAIQRTYGHGFISVVGLDVSLGAFSGREWSGGNLPDADIFWNPILGKRQDAPRATDLNGLQNEQLLRANFGRATNNLLSGRLVADLISLSGSAAAGLGLAFLLFAVYWTIAGPGGFFLLKSVKKTRHAWLLFFGTSVAFTAIAWIGVYIVRDNDTRLQHVTVLDFIARPPDATRPAEPQLHRATSWLSVYLPGYGETTVALDGDANWRNVIAPFTAPDVDYTRFRNVTRYTVPIDSMDAYTVPARATTKEMYVRWTGAADEEFSSLFEVVEPISIIGQGSAAQLQGRIRHNLPGDLQNWLIVFVKPGRNLPPRYRSTEPNQPRTLMVSAGMLHPGEAFSHAQWKSGDTLNLSSMQATAGQPTNRQNLLGFMRARYIDPIKSLHNAVGANFESATGMQDRRRILETLSFFQQVPPPEYVAANRNDNDTRVAVARSIGREIDLSTWFNRPCIILIGYLENSEIPYPLTINGSKPVSSGLTMVRWIYPLPVDPADVITGSTETE